MRDVSEQMRQAAGELQRQNAAQRRGPFTRGGGYPAPRRATAERQQPDGRQRAAGELQLEAQQVAEAQRRVAAEASRLRNGTPGAAAADALRRLAAEKDRLAERVEELARSARQLGAQAGSAKENDPGARAREAAALLDREKIGPRMRDTAKQMREAANGRGASERSRRPKKRLPVRSTRRRCSRRAQRGSSGAVRSARTDACAARTPQQLDQQLRDAGSGRGRMRAADEGSERRQARRREGRKGAGAPRGADNPAICSVCATNTRASSSERATPCHGCRASSAAGRTWPRRRRTSSADPPLAPSVQQDYSGWDALRREIDLAMERYEASVSDRLIRNAAADRFDAGGSERVPDAYRQSIARYYQSLAKLKK